MNHEPLDAALPSRDGVRDRALVLRSQTMFEGLDEDGFLMLAEHARSVTYRAGAEIVPEGSAPYAIHVITAGEIQVQRQGKALNLLGVGSAFGALPLLARASTLRAIASKATRIIEVPAAAFETALDENHSLLRNALRVMGGALLNLRGQLPSDPNASTSIDEGTYFAEPRPLVERILELRASPFGYINVEALVDLARLMVEVRFAAGERIWSAGDTSTGSMHVAYGRVRCTAPDRGSAEGGTRLAGKHADVGRGFTIGVLDVWGERRRAYEARAETDVIGFHIEFESFLSLLESHPEVGIEILRGFARSLLSIREGR